MAFFQLIFSFEKVFDWMTSSPIEVIPISPVRLPEKYMSATWKTLSNRPLDLLLLCILLFWHSPLSPGIPLLSSVILCYPLSQGW